MYITTLNKHFNNNPTYIAGDWIKNGCTTFQLHELDEVCDIHSVPECYRNDVRQIIEENRHIDNSEQYYDHATMHMLPADMRTLLAHTGKFNEQLYQDAAYSVLYPIINQGFKLEYFAKHDSIYVRHEVAELRQCLDILINDREPEIRSAVAEYGTYEHRKILANDSHRYVRRTVAEHCDESLLEQLSKDSCWEVRAEVARRGVFNEIFLKDEDWFVRTVAADLCNKIESLEKILTDEPNLSYALKTTIESRLRQLKQQAKLAKHIDAIEDIL